MKYYLAIDIGASSGRHILGWLEEGKLVLQEIFRFENGCVQKEGHYCWESERLFQSILQGMKICKETNRIPETVAIDTWGVDFALLDENGTLLGDTVGYRDHRTEGTKQLLDRFLKPEERYEKTGIADQSYNTVNQLLAVKRDQPQMLDEAKYMLMTPDYYNFLLTGQLRQEYTMATTTQLMDARKKDWDRELLQAYGLPERIFLKPENPGTFVGKLRQEWAEEIGFSCRVMMAPSHDTASAAIAMPGEGEDNLFISSGTWSLLGVESRECMTQKEAMQCGFTNEGGYDQKYTIVKNIMGLWMIQSVRKEQAPDMDFSEIASRAEKAEITSIVDCNDASFLAPESMTEAIQKYCRETQQQVPEGIEELAAVVYRSLARCYAQSIKELENLTGHSYDKIYIIGGGCQAEFLNRLTSQYAGCSVSAGPVEATAIGNLLSQMIADQQFSDIDDARKCLKNSFEVKEYTI